MFDIGWTEMLVVAVVAIVVVGPKDLPKMLRAFGKTMSGIRKMAGDFQKQFDDAIKEADLEDVKKIASGNTFKPLNDIKDSTEAFKKQVKEQMEASVLPEKKAAGESNLPKPVADKLKAMDDAKQAAADVKVEEPKAVDKPAAKPAPKTKSVKKTVPAKTKAPAGKKA